MVFLSLILIIVTSLCPNEVNAQCRMVDWSQSFKRESLSQCSNYIRGFMVNGKDGEENIDIGLLEGVECCTPSYPWSLSKLQTVHQNWWNALNSRGRVSCPEGFFLRGLRRTQASPGYLSNIEEGRCSKPADHPHYYNGNCLFVDISKCTSGKGLCKCPNNYFVTGLGRDEYNQLSGLKELQCCKMWDEPIGFSGMEEVKELIMDITHPNLALLGHYLGYGWTGGCMEPYVGEGYRRVGDTMKADKSFMCEGYKSDHRLNLAYGNWDFEFKNITYGEPKRDLLIPDTVDSGEVVNNDSQPTSISYEVTKTVVRSVTHTIENAWKEAHTFGKKFSYSVKATENIGVGGELSYIFNYEKSSTTTTSNMTNDSRQYKATLSKTLEPYSSKNYRVVLAKTRTTLPYTATCLVKFSVDFQGFLRWGGGYHGKDTNYHQQYRGSGDRPTFHYQFGDASEPFYSALKKQSSRSYRPWQWHEMKAKYPYLQPLIDDLTKESHYEFTLSGKFEDVMSTHIEKRWDSLTKVKRETLTSGAPKNQVLKGLHIAMSGADDVPAKVVAPKVSLDNAKLCDFDAPINISTLV